MKKLEVVGGHASKQKGKDNEEAHMMVNGDKIYKLFQSKATPGNSEKSRGDKEVEFYQQIFGRKKYLLKKFLPKFYGVEEIDGKKFICLENLLYGFKEARILDLKMGQKTYGEDASPEKIKKEENKYAFQKELGFRLTGMKTSKIKTDRSYGLSLTPKDVEETFKTFFSVDSKLKQKVLEKLIAQIEEIEICFKAEPIWRFYACSLLITYEGSSAVESEEVRVKLIDFAHVHEIRDDGVDDGFIHGLSKLTEILKSILSGNCPVVGGHEDKIQLSSNTVAKTVTDETKLAAEVSFYKAARRDSIFSFIPKLLKQVKHKIVLENVMDPENGEWNVMDIKLGKQTFLNSANNEPEKKYYKKLESIKNHEELKEYDSCKESKVLGKRDYMKMRDLTTTSDSLCFRLTGYKTGSTHFTQNEARNIDSLESFLSELKIFCPVEELRTQYVIELYALLDAMRESNLLKDHFIVGCSLLMCHAPENKIVVKLIDFANYDVSGSDNKLIDGVENIVAAFNCIEYGQSAKKHKKE
eukprot:augustus_masked-scaffold_16-processed-gene-1.4-mRNA-1 protein AED:1.00 eAED:1.00 QI:0/-1/0/0/-1/1/1/0/525